MSLIVSCVTDDKELKDIFRLRYKVFCHEWGFEKPENHTNGIVTDSFDKNAVHFAAKNESQKIVGAIMLILDSTQGYPIEKYCKFDINKNDLPKEGIAEISRLVVHRDYRRRSEDKYIYGPDEERRSIGSFDYPYHYTNGKMHYRRTEDKIRYRGTKRVNSSHSERRKRHEVVSSLYKAVYQESKQRQLTHWYAVMTKGIATLLSKFGMEFQAIGDPVDYHGIRTPYLGEIAKIEDEMSNKNPELYEEFTRDL